MTRLMRALCYPGLFWPDPMRARKIWSLRWPLLCVALILAQVVVSHWRVR